LDGHLAVARELGLCLIVDCAQAYCGPGFCGDPRCDASLYSFGPIKNSTALGGALLRVRDPQLLTRMRDVQSDYPIQSRLAFAIRVVKYAIIKLISTRVGLRSLFGLARLLGRDPDDWLNAAARGFPSAELLRALRRRPAYPLLKLLTRRLKNDDPQRREVRVQAGQRLADGLASVCDCPTVGIPGHAYWVFPILVDDPAAVRMQLHAAGFDTSRAHSLRAVSAPPGDERTAPIAENTLLRLIFLPLDESMPTGEQERMARVVRQAVGGTPRTCRTPS
jgi:dTDP-4-amino-4,6-dideoxygalactose transaminase